MKKNLSPFLQRMVTIYVLGLQQAKYYVGSTTNFDIRFAQHQGGSGSAFTKLYPIVKVEKKFEGEPLDEEKTVLAYMAEHGIDNVRGGSYSNVVLTQEQHISAMKAIYNASGSCMACGSKGHFIGQCKMPICYRCGRLGHLVSSCYATSHVSGGKLDGCYRCGRDSHWAIRCNRSKDVYGRSLDASACSVM